MKEEDVLNGEPAKVLVIEGDRVLYTVEAKIVPHPGAGSGSRPSVELTCVVPSEKDQKSAPKVPTLRVVGSGPLWPGAD